jgi:hypothetical protein
MTSLNASFKNTSKVLKSSLVNLSNVWEVDSWDTRGLREGRLLNLWGAIILAVR